MELMPAAQLIAQARLLLEQQRLQEAANLVNLGLIAYPRHPGLIGLHRIIPAQYDAAFYEDAYRVSYTSARRYLRQLWPYYGFASVVDVGAGAGPWSHAATECAAEVVSIDGEWVKAIHKPCDRLHYLYQDLNAPLDCAQRFDLALCVEVAEHLEPARSLGLINDICQLAPVVVFGAALPRQGGSGHINCRPHSFWIDLFRRNHFTAYDLFRPAFWYDGQVGPWYAQNTYLFASEALAGRFSGIAKPSLVDVYHPRIVADSPICLGDHTAGLIDPGA